MTRDILQFIVYAIALVALAVPLGLYMARVFAGQTGFLSWAERPIFALAGLKPEQGQHWSSYALGLIAVIVNDLIGDIHGERGLGGWLLKVMGFAGDEPHVPGPVKLLLGKHKAEVAQQFRRWADRDDLRRIVVSHGDTIEGDARGALRKLAASID